VSLWNPAHTVEVFEWLDSPSYCTACVPKDMPDEEVLAQVNLAHPQGQGREWKASCNVCDCPEISSRVHLAMEC
jgi:hypothetical protein